MDFDQWKPLTGRGDPLRNDPTYDYEPPVLERVHYWADDTRLEREHYPERKSEVLMLGVSSRRPSVAPRPPPSRRHQRPHLPPKYEDFSYKINEHYPLTILVPPPPPPPGHHPPLYVLPDSKVPLPNSQIKVTDPPKFTLTTTTSTTITPEHLTSLYALQESNLIYQSSTTNQNWISNFNQTKSIPNLVSSDYAGWGPTTPLDENIEVNDTHNLILTDQNELYKHPYTFYKPMLSEAPPPPQPTLSSIFRPTFVPTVLPPTEIPQNVFSQSSLSITPPIYAPTDATSTEIVTDAQDYNNETTTERPIPNKSEVTLGSLSNSKPEKSLFDMLGPMLSMPLINGPERPEDNLYAHASENVQIFKEHSTEDSIKLETMQTMQPPPPGKIRESSTTSESYNTNPHFTSNLINTSPTKFTHDPYLHMRFTTTTPTTVENQENTKPTTGVPTIPFIIIQGHSKVKTYSSKPNLNYEHDTFSNEIPKVNETDEVKHLHPIREKKTEKIKTTRDRSKSLKSLVDNSFGSIEIQETDIGIKYDVSDGSGVPIEIYRKGIVERDENSYVTSRKENRQKRQIDLEDLLPFDEDTIEEYVYNFLNGKRNSTGITGLIAQAVTSDAASVVDELEEDGEDSEHEDDER